MFYLCDLHGLMKIRDRTCAIDSPSDVLQHELLTEVDLAGIQGCMHASAALP